MKKALLTVLIVLFAVTAVFANYGLDFSGKFVSNSIKAKDGYELATSLKPYVSEGNYKVQLRFDWEANGSGFTQFKIDNKNVLTIASSIFAFVDNAYLEIGNSTLGIERNVYDTPFLYFRGQVGRFSYDIDANISFPVDTTLDSYTVPVEADIKYVYSTEFPFTVGTDTTGKLIISDEGIGYNVKPNLYLSVPIKINDHPFTVGYSFTTEMQKASVVIDPLKTIEVESSIASTWGFYSAKDTVKVVKSDSLSFAFTLEKKFVLGDGTLSFKGYLPLTLATGSIGPVYDTTEEITSEYLSLSYLYQKEWFSFGFDVKAKGLFMAKAQGLTVASMLNEKTFYFRSSAFVGFDTIPFDLKLVLTPTSYLPFDATFGVLFNVNVENYLSQEN